MKRLFALLACSAPLAVAAADAVPANFTGRFFGTLADGACASQDALLTLHADGRYALQTHCQEDLQAAPVRRGRWSMAWNGTCVQLAPDRPPAQSLEFAIHDDNLLVLTTGSCIEPVEDPRGRTLRRALDGAGND